MGAKISELGALAVSKIAKPGLHAVGGVAGLGLQISNDGARSWILRAVVGSKRREMGLGRYPDVTLAMARDTARQARQKIRDGLDPIEQAQAARSALIAAQAKAVTFEQAATAYIEAQEAGWRNAKHGQQWRSTLETYAYPVIGGLLVRDIDLAHILNILEPIWTTKTETASRIRGRIEKVLDWAKGRGYRAGDNPAAWRGNLETQLAKKSRVAKVEHHKALPFQEIGPFMQRLRNLEGMGARALEFVILTAARSGEVRGASWPEIDLANSVWTVPASRMKAGKEHRVPLSPAAVKLLRALPRFADTELVFASSRGAPLSDMTLSAVMKRMDVDAVPHGFRSTFRDWIGERTNYPSHVAEMALAHAIENKVEAAYRRGDLFDKRRKMMNDWATFCATVEVKSARVTPIRQSA